MKVVVIDPGHGGWDQGSTPCDLAQGGVMEAERNWQLSKALRAYLLAHYEVQVLYTHEGSDTSLDHGNHARELAARCWVANAINADLLVSIHHNAGESKAAGGELYVWTKHVDPEGGLVWEPANDGRPDQNHTDPKSYPIAKVVLPHLREILERYGVGWRSYGDPVGIACANFGILRNTRGPAILVETHYGTNAMDAAAARHPLWPPSLAKAIGEGIAEALGLPKKQLKVYLPNGQVLSGEMINGQTWATIGGTKAPVRPWAEAMGRKVTWIPPEERDGPAVVIG